MSERVALGLLIVCLMLSIEVYLATYTLGTFHISFWKFSPTELRILLAVGNLVLLWRPEARAFGTTFSIFDAGGMAGIIGMSTMLVVAVLKHARTLYNAERL